MTAGRPEVGLAELGRRLAMTPHLGFGVGRPEGNGWIGVDDLVASGLVDTMAMELLAREGRGDVAGSYLGSHLTAPLVTRTVAAVVSGRRCPDPDPANVAVHLHEDGWFDALQFRRPTVAVVAVDEAAGDPSAVVLPDAAALRAWWAERLAACVTPLLDAVRARLPYGRRGLWGAVADQIGATVLAVTRATGGVGSVAWAEANLLLDSLDPHAPVAVTRPQALAVRAGNGREGWFCVRGTCCLYYLTVDHPDPAGNGYCTTCPFTDGDNRYRRLVSLLEGESSGGG